MQYGEEGLKASASGGGGGSGGPGGGGFPGGGGGGASFQFHVRAEPPSWRSSLSCIALVDQAREAQHLFPRCCQCLRRSG